MGIGRNKFKENVSEYEEDEYQKDVN